MTLPGRQLPQGIPLHARKVGAVCQDWEGWSEWGRGLSGPVGRVGRTSEGSIRWTRTVPGTWRLKDRLTHSPQVDAAFLLAADLPIPACGLPFIDSGQEWLAGDLGVGGLAGHHQACGGQDLEGAGALPAVEGGQIPGKELGWGQGKH